MNVSQTGTMVDRSQCGQTSLLTVILLIWLWNKERENLKWNPIGRYFAVARSRRKGERRENVERKVCISSLRIDRWLWTKNGSHGFSAGTATSVYSVWVQRVSIVWISLLSLFLQDEMNLRDVGGRRGRWMPRSREGIGNGSEIFVAYLPGHSKSIGSENRR